VRLDGSPLPNKHANAARCPALPPPPSGARGAVAAGRYAYLAVRIRLSTSGSLPWCGGRRRPLRLWSPGRKTPRGRCWPAHLPQPRLLLPGASRCRPPLLRWRSGTCRAPRLLLLRQQGGRIKGNIRLRLLALRLLVGAPGR